MFGCSGETIKGTYKCSDCLYEELNFKENGEVEISAGGIKAKAEYVVEEKTITVSTETSDYLFTIKDANTLEGKEDAKGTYQK